MPAQLLSDDKLLQRLIAFDTTSANSNRPLVSWLTEYVAGHDVRVLALETTDEKSNLLLSTGPDRDDGSGLLMNGHVDVVPANEPQWERNPFAMQRADDRYIGRGTCDMKGAVALMVNRLCAASNLTAPLKLLLTHDEEVGSLGAAAFLEQASKNSLTLPRQVLIGEPTELRAVCMHKGHIKVRITIRGKAAHSGSPHLGRNSIEPLGPMLSNLNALAERWRTLDHEFDACFQGTTPHPVLAPTKLDGGVALNVVPERTELFLSVRPVPGMQTDAVMQDIASCVEGCNNDCDVDISVLGENPVLEPASDQQFFNDVCAMIGQEGMLGVSFASDGGFLSRLGGSCVILGPGSIEVAHRPNEFVTCDEFERAGDLYQDIIAHCCCQ